MVLVVPRLISLLDSNLNYFFNVYEQRFIVSFSSRFLNICNMNADSIISSVHGKFPGCLYMTLELFPVQKTVRTEI
jgi:hypothetical protein